MERRRPEMADRTRPAGPPVTSTVTPRGLEINIATPHVIVGCLGPLVMLLGFTTLILFLISDVMVDGWEGWRRTLEELFGWWWLALGVLLSVLLSAFSRFSNEHLILGTRTLRRQFRMGRIVYKEDTGRISGIGEIEVQEKEDGWCSVRWRVERWRTWYPVGTLPREEAEVLAQRIRAWLAAPGSLPLEETPRLPMPVALAETAVSVVGSRLTMVIPLLLGISGLLVLALGWQLHEAQQGRAAPLPRLDRVADGELVDYRWVVRGAKYTDRMHAQAHLRLAIAYTTEDGERRTLWLKSRQAPEVINLPYGHLQRVTAMFGAPALEFHVPRWSDAAIREGPGWAKWRSLELDRTEEQLLGDSYYAARLLNGLDEPFHFLTALWTSPPPDWRVAYSSASPDRAMPLRWAEAERAALQQVSLPSLWPLGVVALLLVFATLPGFVPGSGYSRWVGRLAVLGGLAAIPYWADRVEGIPAYLGAGDWLLDFVGDALRVGAPDALVGHAFLVRSHPPASADTGYVVLHWAPERSASYGLLQELGLDVPPPQLPLADSAAATDYMRTRAATALTALDDERLVAFAVAYEAAGWRTDGSALHAAVVAPTLCRLVADPERPAWVRQSLERATRCDEEEESTGAP